MKCDLHVHTIHSGMCTVPVAKNFCRESYNRPEAVYAKLKRLGMDLVTVTDHDCIDACESLRSHSDFFLSEEVTATLPSGTEAHIGVYDITDRDHIEINRRRHDFESLAAYLREHQLLYGINHVFSGLTGRRSVSDYELFETFVPCMEIRNGAMLRRANAYAAELASRSGKAITAGSDAHTMAGVGSAWTQVRGAKTKQEFLNGVRAGKGIARGVDGSFFKLMRDVVLIVLNMMKERPITCALSPLVAGVPLVLLVNYWLEVAFAEKWFGRVTHRELLPLAAPSLAGEVQA